MVVLRRCDDVEDRREVDGGLGLVHQGEHLPLNRIGTRISELLERDMTPRALEDALVAEFPSQSVAFDWARSLERLAHLGLVRGG